MYRESQFRNRSIRGPRSVADSNPHSVDVISRFFAGRAIPWCDDDDDGFVIRIQGFRQTGFRLRWSRGWSANSVPFERLSRDRSLSLHARARRRRSYLHTRSSYLASRLYSHCTKRSCRLNRFPLPSIFR